MKPARKKSSPPAGKAGILEILKERFEKNPHRHRGLDWKSVEKKIKPAHLKALEAMESTGGEPDLIVDRKGRLAFCDCAAESPAGRRSLCYDRAAREARKEHKPKSSALEMAASMGIELLDEETYRHLQSVAPLDERTSSWIRTPDDIRRLGGALFCDRRYGQVFVYHNGAESYYAARGFRGLLQL